MHILVNILFIFIFLFTLFYFKFPNLRDNRYILHKIIIFISLFCFQFVISIISKIKAKCKINIHEIISSSLRIAITGIIGYSIWNDLLYSGIVTKYYMLYFGDPKILYLNVTIIITLFITTVEIIKLLCSAQNIKCIKYN